MRARIDTERCKGCGMCVIIAPETFCLECSNPHSIAAVRREELSGDLLHYAQIAGLHCPTKSISLEA